MHPDSSHSLELKLSTEEVILQAAQAVFMEKGVAGARMQEIADRAGINKALLHYYFKTKDKLSEQVVARTMGLMVPRLHALLNADTELFDKLRAVAAEYSRFLRAHPHLPLFVTNEAHRSPHLFLAIGELEISRLAPFEQQVAAAVASGRIRPVSALQLLLRLVSLMVFPLLGQPLFQAILNLSPEQFEAELTRHHTDAAEFIIQGLQP